MACFRLLQCGGRCSGVLKAAESPVSRRNGVLPVAKGLFGVCSGFVREIGFYFVSEGMGFWADLRGK